MLDSLNEQTFLRDYLSANGIDDIDAYLYPDKIEYQSPDMYVNMREAVDMFKQHLDDGDKIVIVQDSDQDGSCSAAITYMLCREFGATDIVVLFHTDKQHGISDIMPQILTESPKLVIVPDAGSNDVAPCQELKERGIDCLVLDHHEIAAPNECAIVVNPFNDGQDEHINKFISGTGVVEKFAIALGSKQSFKDIVAISLVSDMCDLRSPENRKYINDGLLNPTNPFIKYALVNCCNRGVNPEGVAFGIAPLGNALARYDDQASKRIFFDALVGNIEPESAVKSMKAIKSKQDYQVKKVVDNLSDGLDTSHKVIIGFSEPSYKSYLGLAANKFCGKYKKPTFILRELNSTTWSGSMRSPIDLLNIINKSGLAKCQGHGAACGVTVAKGQLKRFAQFLDTLDIDIEPEVDVAAQIEPNNITTTLARTVCDNAILWGQNLNKPLFHLTLDSPQIYIYRNRSTTVKLVQDGIEFVKFFVSNDNLSLFEQANGKSIEVVVSLGLNEYNGEIKPQAIVERFEIVEKQENNEIDWEAIFQ